MIRRLTVPAFLVVAISAIIVSACLPKYAGAEGSAADAQCNPVIPQCGCGQVMQQGQCQQGQNKYMCPCQDTTNGFSTAGVCIAANKCQAQSTNGGGLGDISKLLQGIGQLMQALNQQQQQGQSSSPTTGANGVSCTASPTNSDGTQATYSGTDANGCPIYTYGTGSQTSSSAAATAATSSDAGNTINYSSDNGTNNSQASSDLSSALGDLNAALPSAFQNVAPDLTSIVVSTSTPTGVLYVNNQVFGGQDGVSGDIQVSGTGITAFASNRDSSKNTQVSAFYGEDGTPSISPPQFVYRLCLARPWADNFLTFIVPTTFFDSVCRSHGFVPPPPAPVPPPAAAKPAKKVVTIIEATSTPPRIPPAANIYAVPSSVRSGFRTSVFWSAVGVDSCTETSSDGGFSASTISGHAASQPLAAQTIFTISCLAGTSTVSDSATVPVVVSN